MNSIPLRNNISAEQYQMAVRVLEAIGIEVEIAVPSTHYDEILKRKENRLNGTSKCELWEDVKQELLDSK